MASFHPCPPFDGSPLLPVTLLCACIGPAATTDANTDADADADADADSDADTDADTDADSDADSYTGSGGPLRAVCTVPEDVFVGVIVVLNGSRSTVPDGGTLTYEWTLSSYPAGSDVRTGDIVGVEERMASFTPDIAGLYLVSLQVTDGTRWAEPADCLTSATVANLLRP